jgi:beta-galactosidase
VTRNDRVEWSVPYVPGVLEARGYRADKLVETARVETTGLATQLVLTPDRTMITADGADATVFTIEARDAQGRNVPTACNLVRFTIAGGKIIGVGNGDPSCLEPDQFLPELALTSVSKWRGRIAPAPTTKPGKSDGFNPLVALGDWKAPLPQPGEVYELAAEFTSGKVPAGVTLDLFLPTLGSKTTVWLNGREVVRGLDTTVVGPALHLDATALVTGVNRVQIIVTPFEDGRRRLPQLSRLGNLRVTSPPPVVQRSLFNGYAQVIVQAPRSAGEIRLTAEADGLKPATSTISAR